jgi:hypothetical protein
MVALFGLAFLEANEGGPTTETSPTTGLRVVDFEILTSFPTQEVGLDLEALISGFLNRTTLGVVLLHDSYLAL